MKNLMIVGGVTAIATGVLIGIQSMFSGRAGQLIGPINTGFWTNFLGGCLAGLLILGVGLVRGFDAIKITPFAARMVLLSGALGIFIIMGVSFSISRTGLAAGMAALILGQLVFGTLSDTYGWGGLEPIPLDTRRIIGLATMALAVVLLFPTE
ncbi:MAG: bacterial/archaeal transporter family-2 protein [Chloroflexota bacterium]|nr:bacterial/archaeal transporter family-2 protein [Chloroflexota bacterium]